MPHSYLLGPFELATMRFLSPKANPSGLGDKQQAQLRGFKKKPEISVPFWFVASAVITATAIVPDSIPEPLISGFGPKLARLRSLLPVFPPREFSEHLARARGSRRSFRKTDHGPLRRLRAFPGNRGH